MNLEELRAVQADERDSDSLQPLPDSFYQDAADYLAELRDERQRAADRADDPFGSEEVRRLSDEIQTAEGVLEAIYERRIGKVVARASLAAADMPADQDGLTDEEAALFADLVERIETNRETVLAAIAGEASLEGTAPNGTDAAEHVPDQDGSANGDAESGGVLDAETAMGGEADSDFLRGEPPAETGAEPEPDGGSTVAPDPDPPQESPPDAEDAGEDTDRMTVRITQDVGEVFGVDERVYDLAAEDVVTLPTPNAEPLIEQDAAQPLD